MVHINEMVADLPEVHTDGSWWSANISRIVELIREYDPTLDVKYIPRDKREPGDSAFCITERLRDGREVVAFYVHDESEFDERVLTRVYAADNQKKDVQAAMEAHNNAIRAIERKRYEESLADAADKARFLWRTPLHTVQLGEKKLHL